tara:strand:- start:4666 stop:5307 length:642 start_codon:yes stop_codon:yes gene_type:complete
MKTFQRLTAALSLGGGLLFAGGLSAQIVLFDFTGGSLEDSIDTANMTATTIETESSFNSFTSSSGWDSAAQISGASSFFSGPTSQALAGDAVYFTITAAAGYELNISGFSFQARSTSAAPQDVGFTVNGSSFDFSADYSNDSTITLISNSSLGLTGQSSVTFSVQGWNSSGSSALQLDNISVTGSVSAVPEPSAYGAVAGLLAIGLVVSRRRR